jgi:hypothetical protein
MYRQLQISRRTFVTATLLASAIPSAQKAARQEGPEATPPSSNWSVLSSGSTFEPITQGTVDDLLLVSGLITIIRVAAEPGEPGLWSFYNDKPGMIGPRVIYVEQGPLEVGPLNISPGSVTGPTLLVRRVAEADREKLASPAVVLLSTTIECRSGELMFFPADTAFEVSNFEGKTTATYLEIDVFPTYTSSPGVVIEGMVAERLAVDLGIATADLPAPPVVTAGRLMLEPQVQALSPGALSGPQIFYVEQGSLTVMGHEGKPQLKRGSIAAPGEIVEPEIEFVLTAGDAFMIPPGGSSTIQNTGDAARLLVIEVRAPK